MREILFKAKQPDDGKWVEGYLIKISEDDYRIATKSDIEWSYTKRCDYDGVMTKINPETICQYTGLTDKNGKKVYENDIIETITFGFNKDHFITIVKFGASSGVQGFYLANGRMMFYFGQSDLTKMDDTKVIGNIFDNPELLENK